MFYDFKCIFTLNGEPISSLRCDSRSYPAFSGQGNSTNKRSSACIPNIGPIPPGQYYILDRKSGGFLGKIRDMFTDRDQWFALYAIDKNIDDEVFCNDVKRGLFRLHAKGPLSRSEGCVVIDDKINFFSLRNQLKESPKKLIPGTEIVHYGILLVN